MNRDADTNKPISLLLRNKKVVVLCSKTNNTCKGKNKSFNYSSSLIEHEMIPIAAPQFKDLFNALEQKTKKEDIRIEFPKIAPPKPIEPKPKEPVVYYINQASSIRHALTSTRHLYLKPTELPKASVTESRLDNYVIGKEIGLGAYAKVKLCQHKLTGKRFAIKIYDRLLLIDKAKRRYALQEVEIIKKLNHPNIVKYKEFIEENNRFYLIMEEAKGISLLSYIKSLPKRRMPEVNARSIFKQLIEALAYMHSKNVYHRDIKMENIILDERLRVKLIDFGFGVYSSDNSKLSLFCGTPSYMSPEMVLKKEYFGSAVDVWSVGVVLYVLLCGTFPFKGRNDQELSGKITKGVLTFSEGVSSKGKQLLRTLLVLNSSERPSAESILKNEWVCL